LAARQAAYSANLVLLAVITAGTIHASQLYPSADDAVDAWHADALLWHSQLSHDEWDSFLAAFALDRIRTDQGQRDIRLTLDDGSFRVPAIDPYWIRDEPLQRPVTFGSDRYLDYTRRRANFQCGGNDDAVLQALDPLCDTVLVTAVNTFVGWLPDTRPSALQALIDVWLLPIRNPTDEQRKSSYQRCTQIARYAFPRWSDTSQVAYTRLLVTALTTDHDAPIAVTAEVLTALATTTAHDLTPVAEALVRCALATLDRHPNESLDRTRVADLVLDLNTRYPTSLRSDSSAQPLP
jgi:hypothetical protein